MHSNLKLQDPFNFSHCTGVHARTLHINDFIYMLNLDFFLMLLELILIIIKNMSGLICVTGQEFNA